MFYTRLAAAVALTVFAAGALADPQTASPLRIGPPFTFKKVIPEDFPDPAIAKFDGIWYAYATVGNGINAQLAMSQDGDNWTLVRGYETLPNPGLWADQHWPGIWAPDVARVDSGKYVMYYSAKLATLDQHCIGVGYADSPTGPFVARSTPVICPIAQGGAIDSASFQIDGKMYIVYKVDGNNIGHGGSCNNGVPPLVATPIMLQQVNPRDGFTKIGNPVKLLDRGPEDGPLVEAPSLVRTPDGRFVLFYSSNCFLDSKYHIAYAWADRLTGPYTKIASLAVTGMGELYAPGGADISPDGRKLAFHASNGTGGRAMFIANITFDWRRRLVLSS